MVFFAHQVWQGFQLQDINTPKIPPPMPKTDMEPKVMEVDGSDDFPATGWFLGEPDVNFPDSNLHLT